MPRFSVIAAMDSNRGIGKNGTLPWGSEYPEDLKHFREVTMGHVLIMGRKTAESLPQRAFPLPGRTCVVVSSRPPGRRLEKLAGREFTVMPSLSDASNFALARDNFPIIIGGGSLYQQVLDADLVHTMYLTHLEKAYDCDTYFPQFNPSSWGQVELSERAGLTFSTLTLLNRNRSG